MKKEEKGQRIEKLAEELKATPNFYLVDILGLNAVSTSELRKECYDRGLKLKMVKNTFLERAMKATDLPFDTIYGALKGSLAVLYAAESNSEPAKMIKKIRGKEGKLPNLKAAFLNGSEYLGSDQLDFLAALKSKTELIAEVILLLQSPAKRVVSQIGSGGAKLVGLLEAIKEKSKS